jgi:hypothetical protein
MNLPASGNLSIDGVQAAMASGLILMSVGVDIPMMKQSIPPIPAAAPIPMFTAIENIAPRTIRTIPEIRKFSLRFFIESTHCIC